MYISIIFSFFILFVHISPNFCDNDPINTYRLVNDYITVLSYNIQLRPNLDKDGTFEGDVKINIYPMSPIECFTINSKNLKINEISVVSSRQTHTASHLLIPEKEMLKICVSPKLYYYTVASVQIKYSGSIYDEFKGLYKIQYEEKGARKWLIATQFEPTYARMVFPCFDEPEYRAKFILTLARRSDQVASSITPVDSTNKNWQDDQVMDTFKQTKPIPTYTLAFIIHGFTSLTKTPALSVYSKGHTQENTKFFHSFYHRWYKELEQYLNIENDPSIEIAAVPDADKYSRKAGSIIYKEKDTLHIHGTDVEKHKQQIAQTAIRKITHLWLGRYVAPYWWDETWLAESLATFFQYLILSKVEPTWRMDDLCVVEVVQPALMEDSNSKVAVSAPTGHPSEIQSQRFDSKPIKKGASIIRMLEHLIDSNTLQKTLQKTLINAHSRNGALEAVLWWDEIETEIREQNILPPGQKIHTVMDKWIKNEGHPLVTVIRTPEGNIEINQEVYRSPLSLEEILDKTWSIPITCSKQPLQTSTTSRSIIWSLGKDKVTVNTGLKEKEWIICNLRQEGYFRVNYDKSNWYLIIEQLKTDPTKFDVKNRAQLIDDAMSLATTGKLTFPIALKLGTYLEKENDMIPWLALCKHTTFFLQLYEKTNVWDYLKSYFGFLIKYLLHQIGFNSQPNDSYITKTGRSTILALACHLNLKYCHENVAQVYNNNINDLTKVPTELKYIVYCNSFKIAENQETAWNKLWAIYKNSNVISEKELILKALACSHEPSFLQKYVTMALHSEDPALYMYEKDVIIKSISQSSDEVTATLNVIDELVSTTSPQLENTISTMILMIDQISFNVQYKEHISKLEKIIVKVENEKKSEPLLKSLKKCRTSALMRTDYADKHAEEIKQAIHTITGYTPTPPPPTLPPTTKPPQTQKPQTEKPITKPIETTTATPETVSRSNNALPCVALHYALLFGFFIKYYVLV